MGDLKFNQLILKVSRMNYREGGKIVDKWEEKSLSEKKDSLLQ